MIAADAEGIHRDGISIVNAVKAVLQRPAGSKKVESSSKKQKADSAGLDAEPLGKFLLAMMSFCCAKETLSLSLASGPEIGLVALECLRGWASPGPLLTAARLFFSSLNVRGKNNNEYLPL